MSNTRNQESLLITIYEVIIVPAVRVKRGCRQLQPNLPKTRLCGHNEVHYRADLRVLIGPPVRKEASFESVPKNGSVYRNKPCDALRKCLSRGRRGVGQTTGLLYRFV